MIDLKKVSFGNELELEGKHKLYTTEKESGELANNQILIL
jgi:hypothetical protein